MTHICVVTSVEVKGLIALVLPPLDPATKAASEAIGAMLKSARLKQRLSQESLAKRIRMTRTSYARLEKGQTNITIDSLVRIAQGLELALDIRLIEKG